MSSDDNDEKKFSRMMRAWRAEIVHASDMRIANGESLLTLYVMPGMEQVQDDKTIKDLIRLAHGTIVGELPCGPHYKQFQVEIQADVADALYEGHPVLRVGKRPFKKFDPIRPAPKTP